MFICYGRVRATRRTREERKIVSSMFVRKRRGSESPHSTVNWAFQAQATATHAEDAPRREFSCGAGGRAGTVCVGVHGFILCFVKFILYFVDARTSSCINRQAQGRLLTEGPRTEISLHKWQLTCAARVHASARLARESESSRRRRPHTYRETRAYGPKVRARRAARPRYPASGGLSPYRPSPQPSP